MEADLCNASRLQQWGILHKQQKQLNIAENKDKKPQISRREIGSLSHHSYASQKQVWIAPTTLRMCNAYWLIVTDSAMGQGAQLRWVLAQICSWFQWVKLSYDG